MKRKHFLVLTALLPFVDNFFGCKNPTEPEAIPDPTPDLTIKTEVTEVSKQLQANSGLSKDIVNLDQTKVIAYQTTAGLSWLKISQVVNSSADYRHIRLQTKDGQVANLLWGMSGIYASIKLTDDAGKTLVVKGQELEFAISQGSLGKGLGKINGTNGLISTGLKVLAIALAVWLGAKVVGLIISAIAFFAYYAMVLSLLLVAGVIAYGVIQFVFNFFGLTLADVESFFLGTWEYIKDLLSEILEYLPSIK